MPKGTHQVTLDLPIEKIWEIVSDMDRWAPLVPGYIEYEIINERESTWTFKGDLGFMQKTVSLKINITEWTEPTKVTFDLTGLNENFAGNGYFIAESISEKQTTMEGHLDISAKGMMGPYDGSYGKCCID